MFPVLLSLPVHSYFRRFKDYVQFQLIQVNYLNMCGLDVE